MHTGLANLAPSEDVTQWVTRIKDRGSGIENRGSRVEAPDDVGLGVAGADDDPWVAGRGRHALTEVLPGLLPHLHAAGGPPTPAKVGTIPCFCSFFLLKFYLSLLDKKL